MGKSSKPPMESTVISVMPEALSAGISPISSSDQALKLLTSNPTRVLGVLDAGKPWRQGVAPPQWFSTLLRQVLLWAQSLMPR